MVIGGKKEYKTCYEFNCPFNKNICCGLENDEKIALYEKYETFCLFIKDNKVHFDFYKNPLFQERVDFIDSLKVMKKLQSNSVENNNVTLKQVNTWK